MAAEAWHAADVESHHLAELCAESWLYARQSGFAAIDRFQRDMSQAHAEFAGKGASLAERVNWICMSTASKLSADMRADMGIGDLKIAVYEAPATGALEMRAE